MPKTKISEYSATANSNTDVGGINIDEGCAPSGINDAIRTMMAQLKNFQTGTGSDSFNGPVNGTVGATTPATGAFTTLSATGVTTVQAGSASAPAITTSGDTNTGIYFPAADTIAFAEGGAEAMRIDSSGNLGLGVTPSASVANNKWLEINGATALTAYNAGGVYAYSLWGNAVAGKGLNGGKASEYTWDSNSGAWVWRYTPTSTAGVALSGTSSLMTLDASGRLGIGNTSPAQTLDVIGGRVYDSNFYLVSQFRNVANSAEKGVLLGYNNADTSSIIASAYANGSGALAFWTHNNVNWGERARIDSSGNLLVGTTSPDPIAALVNGVQLGVSNSRIASASIGLSISRRASDGDALAFLRNTTQVGSVSVSTVATLYNTTSDQRLKENIVDAAPASALIDSLQVRQYDWKADGSHQRYGFVAQELVTVAPEAVHQPTNPEEMMAVDYSKLVPMLVKEIQSLRQRLAALESN